MKFLISIFVGFLVCALGIQSCSLFAAYTFSNIADTTGTFFSFGAPAINAEGIVTFRAELDTFHTGIYLSDDAGITTVAHNNGTAFQGFAIQTPGIDSDGNVFFAANRTGTAGGGNGIFFGSGGIVDTYALNTSPVGITMFGRPSISANGQVAFRASHVEVPAGPGRTGVFSALDLLETSSGPFLDFGNGNAEIAVNDSGVVVFTANLDAGGSGVYIDSADGGDAIEIASSAGEFSNFVHSSPAINNDGTVAFHASLDAGGQGIFVAPAGQTPSPLATSGGSFSSFAPVVAINSAGTVAFTASSLSGNGIFIGPDFIADRVIRAGEPLFGSTVTTQVISNASINDQGQIAFRYTLANGVNGIAVATPVEADIPGDFDLDGDVDGRDFLVWQRGGSPTALSASDLSDWQANYGVGGLSASVAVPEPGGAVLILALAFCLKNRSSRLFQ